VSGVSFERWLEWLRDLGTYRPSDFLMFSPRAYWRLFELHNETWWPLPVLLPAIGVAALVWAWLGSGRDAGGGGEGGGGAAVRAGALGLGAAAAFVGGAFVFGRYAEINWAARGLSALWAALSLSLVALAGDRTAGVAANGSRRRLASVLALWALLGQPLLAPVAGRPFAQAEVLGLAPDPTALAVLAWLLASRVPVAKPFAWASRVAWWAAVAHCVGSAATLALLGSWLALPLVLAIVASVVVVRWGATTAVPLERGAGR